ncbi:MAG: cell division initiation protein DivIVA, partial [Frankiales bacterium]|nr:cell division initiation protein DivIVA [Frankiales bacterium]
MTVLIGYALIALIVAGVLFYAAVALLPAGLSMKPESDRRPFELPAGRLIERGDLERVRIPVALRGYRFAETDDLIDRLTAEIVVRDEEIARLKAQPGLPAGDGPPVYPSEPDDAFFSPAPIEPEPDDAFFSPAPIEPE